MKIWRGLLGGAESFCKVLTEPKVTLPGTVHTHIPSSGGMMRTVARGECRELRHRRFCGGYALGECVADLPRRGRHGIRTGARCAAAAANRSSARWQGPGIAGEAASAAAWRLPGGGGGRIRRAYWTAGDACRPTHKLTWIAFCVAHVRLCSMGETAGTVELSYAMLKCWGGARCRAGSAPGAARAARHERIVARDLGIRNRGKVGVVGAVTWGAVTQPGALGGDLERC